MFDFDEDKEENTLYERFVQPILWKIRDLRYNLVSRFIKKDHLLDIRSKDFDYTVGYCDPVDKIKLAVFKIFMDFIEKENPIPEDFVALTQDNDHWRHAYEEMAAIYNWLKVERLSKKERLTYLAYTYMDTDWPKYKFVKTERQDLISEYGPLYEMLESRTGGIFYEEYEALNKEIDKKDKDALDRIIKIRDFLWT